MFSFQKPLQIIHLHSEEFITLCTISRNHITSSNMPISRNTPLLVWNWDAADSLISFSRDKKPVGWARWFAARDLLRTASSDSWFCELHCFRYSESSWDEMNYSLLYDSSNLACDVPNPPAVDISLITCSLISIPAYLLVVMAFRKKTPENFKIYKRKLIVCVIANICLEISITILVKPVVYFPEIALRAGGIHFLRHCTGAVSFFAVFITVIGKTNQRIIRFIFPIQLAPTAFWVFSTTVWQLSWSLGSTCTTWKFSRSSGFGVSSCIYL